MMFAKRCFTLVVVVLLVTVNEQVAGTSNSNIFVDKSTVKCKDGIYDWKQVDDFKWRPKSLPRKEPSIPIIIQKKCSNKNLVVRLGVIDDASAVSPDEDVLLVIEDIDNELINGKLKSRLAYPLVLKISQLTPSILTYPIKFLYRVNAQPYEEVISLQSSKDYVGCYFGPEATKPTCGSEFGGFCCSCGSSRGNKCTKPFTEVSEVLQSSAHCLRFSPYWYGVYSMDKPQIYHQVSLQVFRNEELENGTVLWRGMLPGKGVTLSTQKPRVSLSSINLAYHNADESSTREAVKSYVDVSASRLLVPMPNPVSVSEGSKPPEDTLSTLNHPSLEKGSKVEDALLVLSKSLLAPEGLECNRVGTSYSAFVQQNNSCNLPRSSCLTNQPLDLWKSGNYKLSKFGPLVKTITPIKFTAGGKDGALLMENRNNGKSAYFVDLEIRGWKDMNLLSRGYNPILEFVLTDTSWSSGAKVTAQIINSERLASRFKVELRNCPGGLAGESEMKWVQPLESEAFIIDLEKVREINETEECFVVVLNEVQEIVGSRDVKFMDGDTCICAGRCECVCTKEGVGCVSLQWEGLVAAGMEVWDDELRDDWKHGNATSGEGIREIYSLDDTVTRWWFWLIVILGFPILAALFIGIFFWNIWKWRSKSAQDFVSSKQSFPEGDKRSFSIADDDNESEKESSKNVLPEKSKDSSILWKKTPSKYRKSSSKEMEIKPSNKERLPREKNPEPQNSSRAITKASNPRGGSDDALLYLRSLDAMHRRRESIPLVEASLHSLNSEYVNTKPSPLTQNSSIGKPTRSRMETSVVSESKPSDINKVLQETDIEVAALERVDSATHETVSVFQKNPTASTSEEDGLGGDHFTVDLFEGTKGLKLDSHRRYGSWHRKSATASKSILELCELTSSSESRFSFNGRPNPHFNND